MSFLKRNLLGVGLGLLIAGTAQASSMKDLFDSYSNGSPGAYKSSNGTHLYGGNITARIHQPRPRDAIGFTPPDFKGGCGGIDFYAGSFSLISGDEIVQMARGIAQGAAPYFFNLAVSSICSNCSTAMGDLSKRLEELNKFARTSCESFYTRLDSAKSKSWSDSMKSMQLVKLPEMGSELGLKNWADYMIKDSDPESVKTPSIVELLQTNAPYASLLAVTGDLNLPKVSIFESQKDFLETIMTLTGASVFDPAKEMKTLSYFESHLSAKILAFGNDTNATGDQVVKYNKLTCLRKADGTTLEDNCATVNEEPEEMPPLYEFYYELLAGESGLFRNLQKKEELSDDQKRLQKLADFPYLGLAVRLKSQTEINVASREIALEASFSVVNELYRTALSLLLKAEQQPVSEAVADAHKPKMVEFIKKIRADMVELEAVYAEKKEAMRTKFITETIANESIRNVGGK